MKSSETTDAMLKAQANVNEAKAAICVAFANQDVLGFKENIKKLKEAVAITHPGKVTNTIADFLATANLPNSDTTLLMYASDTNKNLTTQEKKIFNEFFINLGDKLFQTNSENDLLLQASKAGNQPLTEILIRCYKDYESNHDLGEDVKNRIEQAKNASNGDIQKLIIWRGMSPLAFTLATTIEQGKTLQFVEILDTLAQTAKAINLTQLDILRSLRINNLSLNEYMDDSKRTEAQEQMINAVNQKIRQEEVKALRSPSQPTASSQSSSPLNASQSRWATSPYKKSKQTTETTSTPSRATTAIADAAPTPNADAARKNTTEQQKNGSCWKKGAMIGGTTGTTLVGVFIGVSYLTEYCMHQYSHDKFNANDMFAKIADFVWDVVCRQDSTIDSGMLPLRGMLALSGAVVALSCAAIGAGVGSTRPKNK
ncbi:MAG: hypothetical protein ACHQAX_06080 [Gammaproteobacteria bacterium]